MILLSLVSRGILVRHAVCTLPFRYHVDVCCVLWSDVTIWPSSLPGTTFRLLSVRFMGVACAVQGPIRRI